MFSAFLSGGDTSPFFVCPDKMATVKKSGFLCNIVYVVVRVQQKVLGFIQTDISDIFLAGAPIIFPETLGKVRAAHVAHICQILDFQGFCAVGINIFQNMIKRRIGVRMGIVFCSFVRDGFSCQLNQQSVREGVQVDRQKIWWVQAESVVGFYNSYQMDPRKTEYLQAAGEIWEFILQHMVDEGSGEWIESIGTDNTAAPEQALVHPWKCPYHNGRMCMEMMQRLAV